MKEMDLNENKTNKNNSNIYYIIVYYIFMFCSFLFVSFFHIHVRRTTKDIYVFLFFAPMVIYFVYQSLKKLIDTKQAKKIILFYIISPFLYNIFDVEHFFYYILTVPIFYILTILLYKIKHKTFVFTNSIEIKIIFFYWMTLFSCYFISYNDYWSFRHHADQYLVKLATVPVLLYIISCFLFQKKECITQTSPESKEKKRTL